VTFKDLFIYVSQGKLGLFDEAQRLLYFSVMLENCELVTSLGNSLLTSLLCPFQSHLTDSANFLTVLTHVQE
jgi:hypothetical protein